MYFGQLAHFQATLVQGMKKYLNMNMYTNEIRGTFT